MAAPTQSVIPQLSPGTAKLARRKFDVVIVSMLWHVWVGMRDIWMDYVKPVSVRLSLEVLTIAWLVGCAGWAVQVLWRL